MQLRPALAQGATLIELVIVIAIAAILMGLAAQNYRTWIANTQIRTAAETLVEGLSAARNEAIRRNRPIDFRLVSDLSADCTESSSGTSWVVSENDPTSHCDLEISQTLKPLIDVDSSQTLEPLIVAKKAGSERTATVTVTAYSATGHPPTGDASRVTFNGVGRVVLLGTTPIARIDVDSSAISSDESRELRIVVSPGGMVRMCDPSPKITDATDPRKCP